MNADPAVMEQFPSVLDRRQSDALVDRIEAQFDEHGFGAWAVERRQDGSFLGFTGLTVQSFPAHFTPAVEVGWRLAASAWGNGYATEAAVAAVEFGFTALGLEEIVSFTSRGHARSRRVMERLGMHHDPADDFEHPGLPEGHRLRPHVLYRLARREWAANRASAF